MRRGAFVLGLGVVMLESTLGFAGGHRHKCKERHLPKVVRRYIAGWRDGNPAAVTDLFATDGTYTDDVGAPLSSETLADYVATFGDAHFRLVDVETEDGKYSIHWRVSHGRCSESIAFRDELVLTSDASLIQSVQSLGYAPSGEVVALLAEYTAGWFTYDGERSAATFVEGGKYYDPDHTDGITPTQLISVIEDLSWAIITGFFGLVVLKDGRLYGRWDMHLADGGYLILQGYDLITLQDDKILTVQGHW
jgi:hypothetical protein